MARMRTTSFFGLAIVIGLAVTGCTTPTAEKTPSPSSSSGTSSAPVETPSPEPSSAPTTAPPEEWTAAELTAACVEYQAGWAVGEGYAADDFDWVTPAQTQENAGVWYVIMTGTFTTPDGDAVPAEFSCSVSGPPDAPVVDDARDS